ncbi:MAG: single-stranded-DNA-specific exonuclease RecJ [Lachnospiraceae bacterium]
MENWVLLRKGADFQRIAERFHISPRLACLIRNRGIIGDEQIEDYLHGTIAELQDGMLIKDLNKAVEIIAEKITERKKIRIIGDYDIDGINATYILLEGIEKLNGNVDIDIPHRIKDGYGLNQSLIDTALNEGVDTIITCDNGIAATQEIAYGKHMGMTIIVTDHHEVPYVEEGGQRIYQLPLADAVVDPKREDCEYPFKELCGAAVAYKLVEALYNVLAGDAEDIDYLMEHVAISTVGDVMNLIGENRIFVRQGLEMLKRTSNLGIKALMECTGVSPEQLSVYHIGYILGPCLNASGRLDTAKRALELLRAETTQEAMKIAWELKELNDSRKELTTEAVEQAIQQVESTEMKQDKVLVVYMPNCHESLAGIVAGKLRERYYKPTFVLTQGDECVKGSGRSIDSYHMFEGLNRCKTLLVRYGGHRLAAGLSIQEGDIEEFRRTINEQAGLTEVDMIPKISIDMQLAFSAITEEFIDELQLLEPFGKGNSKPVFVEKDIEILETRILGKAQNVLKMQLKDGAGTQMEGLYFGDITLFMKTMKGKKMSCTYYPNVNEYRGRKTIQIVIQNYR